MEEAEESVSSVVPGTLEEEREDSGSKSARRGRGRKTPGRSTKKTGM